MPSYRLDPISWEYQGQPGHGGGNPGAAATPPVGLMPAGYAMPSGFMWFQGVGRYDAHPPGEDIWTAQLPGFTAPPGEEAYRATITARIQRINHAGHVAVYSPGASDILGYPLEHMTYQAYLDTGAMGTVFINYRPWQWVAGVQEDVPLSVNGGPFPDVDTQLAYHSRPFVFTTPATMEAGQSFSIECTSDLGSNQLRPAYMVQQSQVWVDVFTRYLDAPPSDEDDGYSPAHTPPLRQWPRSDGLALSSAPRVTGSRTVQGSLRRTGGTTI